MSTDLSSQEPVIRVEKKAISVTLTVCLVLSFGSFLLLLLFLYPVNLLKIFDKKYSELNYQQFYWFLIFVCPLINLIGVVIIFFLNRYNENRILKTVTVVHQIVVITAYFIFALLVFSQPIPSGL